MSTDVTLISRQGSGLIFLRSRLTEVQLAIQKNIIGVLYSNQQFLIMGMRLATFLP